MEITSSEGSNLSVIEWKENRISFPFSLENSKPKIWACQNAMGGGNNGL